jgi:hypothetical protein
MKSIGLLLMAAAMAQSAAYAAEAGVPFHCVLEVRTSASPSQMIEHHETRIALTADSMQEIGTLNSDHFYATLLDMYRPNELASIVAEDSAGTRYYSVSSMELANVADEDLGTSKIEKPKTISFVSCFKER